MKEAPRARVDVGFRRAEHGQGPAVKQTAARVPLWPAASRPASELAGDGHGQDGDQQQRTAPAENNDDDEGAVPAKTFPVARWQNEEHLLIGGFRF